MLMQGGDVVNGDGTGSISIYGESFPLEFNPVQQDGPGYIAMENSVSYRNGCQFFITGEVIPWFTKYAFFGSVLEGMDLVKDIVMKTETDYQDSPLKPVEIQTCGLLPGFVIISDT